MFTISKHFRELTAGGPQNDRFEKGDSFLKKRAMFGILGFRSHDFYIYNPNPVKDPPNKPSFATGILAGVQIQHALQRCNIFHPPELKGKTSSKLPWVKISW